MSDIDFDAVKKEMEAATDPKRLLELALKQAVHDPEGMRKDIRMLDPTCVDTQRVITIKLGSREFKPLVAYPIYTADYVRGYKSPRLLIELDEQTLLPFVQFEAEAKIRDDAPDAVELLKEFLPKETVYGDRSEWERLVKAEREKFTLTSTYTDPVLEFDDYEVRLLRFSTDEQKRFLRRVFVFCWFFIEGAQAPDDEDKTWEVYIVTQKKTRAFVGYVSVYSFLYYLNGTQFEIDAASKRTVRKRVAHFLVLPPWQGQGVGKQLYLSLLKSFVADLHVYEVEVEEPSEAFEVLRDRAHYAYLTSDPRAKELLEDYGDEPEKTLTELMRVFKLDKVQFQRVAEMFIYMEDGQKETRLLKKLIKSRLWDHNYEDLRDMDPATQREQLQKVYENALRTHRVALHLEEPDEEEEEEEEDDEDENEGLPENPAELLLAQLAQGLSSNFPGAPSEKRRRTDD